MTVSVPIGVDDYAKLKQKKTLHVDKSLLLKDLMDDDTEILLFSRPRRFGKTLNMSMIYHFFRNDADSRALFEDTKLWQAGELYRKELNQYPVIFISLKEMKAASFAEAYENLKNLLRSLYLHFGFLSESPALAPTEKETFQSILDRTAPLQDVKQALGDLSRYLAAHYGHPVYLLIDEYDAPIHEAFFKGYYDDLINLFRGMLGWALKGNASLKKGILTGILRIAKESIFSDLNNISVHSLLSIKYTQHFGFLEAETLALIRQAYPDVTDQQLADIKDWYNGYRMHESWVYNPWSILNCLDQGLTLLPYWVNTSTNSLVGDVVLKAEKEMKEGLEQLLQGGSVEITFDENIVFQDLEQRVEAAWGLLVASGYLTILKSERRGRTWYRQVRIPNQELLTVFETSIQRWFSRARLPHTSRILKALESSNIEAFTELLSRFLLHTVSYFDISSEHAEQTYHAFVLGLLVAAEERYVIKSNRESGFGRYDVMMIPRDPNDRGFVFEFKCAKPKASFADMEKLTEVAMQQIKDKRYAEELKQQGINDILGLALVFSSKEVAVKHEFLSRLWRDNFS